MIKAFFTQKAGRTMMGNYTALLFIQGANFILPLITLPYLVRTLESERFGLVMIAQAMAVFLTIIVDFGFNISATREVSIVRNNKEQLSQLFWNVIAVKLLLVIITFSLLLLLVLSVERFSVEPWVYLLSFLLVLGQALFPTWFFQGIERMRVITIVNVLAKVIFTICIFIFVLKPSHYERVPLFNGIGFIVAGIFGLLMSFKYISFKSPNWTEMKGLIVDTFPLFVSNFASSLYYSSNTFILGMVGGDVIAGIYSSMEKLVLAVKNVYVPLYQAIFPWLATKNIHKVRTIIKKMALPIAISGALIALVILLFAQPALHFIYDDPTIESYDAVFKILGLIAIFSSVNMLLLMLYFPAVKAYKYRMKAMITGGLFNVITALIAAHYFGIYGVAITATVTELIILGVATYFYHSKKPEPAIE